VIVLILLVATAAIRAEIVFGCDWLSLVKQLIGLQICDERQRWLIM
jgi:hypothetical protein